MEILGTLQHAILFVLGLFALGCEGFALVDAWRRRADAFDAADKHPRDRWIVVLAVATALGFAMVRDVTSLLGLASFVVAAFYLIDVRPALQRVMGERRA